MNIDEEHIREVRNEIGERLRAVLAKEPQPQASKLDELVRLLHQAELNTVALVSTDRQRAPRSPRYSFQ